MCPCLHLNRFKLAPDRVADREGEGPFAFVRAVHHVVVADTGRRIKSSALLSANVSWGAGSMVVVGWLQSASYYGWGDIEFQSWGKHPALKLNIPRSMF
jgi:hypothetical protein